MTRRRSVTTERGASLILAVGIIALLAMVGAMVLEQVFADTQLSGSERAAQKALYTADAGAVWGQNQLANLLFPNGLSTAATTTPDLTKLLSYPTLPAGDALCPDLTPTACTRWYQLTPGSGPLVPGWVAYGANSNYRVAVTCNPQPCSTSSVPINYSIRSLSLNNDGSRRLIEVVLGP